MACCVAANGPCGADTGSGCQAVRAGGQGQGGRTGRGGMTGAGGSIFGAGGILGAGGSIFGAGGSIFGNGGVVGAGGVNMLHTFSYEDAPPRRDGDQAEPLSNEASRRVRLIGVAHVEVRDRRRRRGRSRWFGHGWRMIAPRS